MNQNSSELQPDALPYWEAVALLKLLRETGHCIVFAESCTAGMIAGCLARIPGASDCMAGSSVVYQVTTKIAWLDVSSETLRDPGPVSQVVAEQMAEGVLQKTPHATVSASVTGHLGPDAPPDQDGTAWSSVSVRSGDGVKTVSTHLKLDSVTPFRGTDPVGGVLRQHRQLVAVGAVMNFCSDVLSGDIGF